MIDRLIETREWRDYSDRQGASSSIASRSAVTALYLHTGGWIAEPRCDLDSQSVERLDPFLPGLERTMPSAQVPLAAPLVMNLIELAPGARHAPFLLRCATIWLERTSSNRALWLHGGLGRRVARWLGHVLDANPTLMDDEMLSARVRSVLAKLVQIGVHEARVVETALERSD